MATSISRTNLTGTLRFRMTVLVVLAVIVISISHHSILFSRERHAVHNVTNNDHATQVVPARVVPGKWEVSTLTKFKYNASSIKCQQTHPTIAMLTINFGVYGRLNSTASLRNREFAQSRCQMYDLFQITTHFPQYDELIAYTKEHSGKLGKYLAAEALLDMYDTILFLDADATVRATAPGCPELQDFVTPLLRHRPNASVFFDSFGNINTSSSSASSSVLDFLNTGAFIMRNTPWTRTFIRKIILQSSKAPQNPLMRLGGITKSVMDRPGYRDTFDQRVIIDLLNQMPFGEVDCNVHFARPTLSSLFAWMPVHDGAAILHAVGVQPTPNQTDILRDKLAASAISC
eukprot:m.95219 g.95219  ORF g.95219 m.95219 type:complete len:346 (+) comp26798_c0_seq1:300-1337(+)